MQVYIFLLSTGLFLVLIFYTGGSLVSKRFRKMMKRFFWGSGSQRLVRGTFVVRPNISVGSREIIWNKYIILSRLHIVSIFVEQNWPHKDPPCNLCFDLNLGCKNKISSHRSKNPPMFNLRLYLIYKMLNFDSSKCSRTCLYNIRTDFDSCN